MNSVKCPHCGKNVEISLAIKHEIEATILQEEQLKHKEELNKLKEEVEEKTEKRIQEDLEFKMKDIQNERDQAKNRTRKLQEQLLETTKSIRGLKDENEKRELEMQKRLNNEIDKAKESMMRKEKEKFELEKLELQKQLEDVKKALEEAQRKGNQKSQQLQGEVLELGMEELLRNSFPNDTIEPVGKGVSGADIRQIVKSPRGFICGVILWESKRTKEWSDKWITKLKDDLRKEIANVSVIVSVELPKEAKNGFGLKDGVWVCNYELTLALATILRQNLLELGYQKAVSANRGEKADQLYSYIVSHEFKQQIDAVVEAYKEINDQIQKERISFERSWKQRAAQAQRIILSTAHIYGTIQGKVGASMPQIKGLDLLEDGSE